MARGSYYCIYRRIGVLKNVDMDKVTENLKLYAIDKESPKIPALFPKWMAFEYGSRDSYGRVTVPNEKKYDERFIQNGTDTEFERIASWSFCSTSRNFYEDILESELVEQPDNCIIPDEVVGLYVDAVATAEKWSDKVNDAGKSLCAVLCKQNPILKNIRDNINLPLPSIEGEHDDLDYEFHLDKIRDIFKTYLTLRESEGATSSEDPVEYILTVSYWG